MNERIFLVEKEDDEFKNCKNKKLYGFRVVDIEDIRGGPQGWANENISDMEDVYLLIHFGGIGNEDELCKEIKKWKIMLDKENVTILPISRGAQCEKATDLYKEVSKCKIPANLEDYKKYWKEKCETFPLKKIIVKWMSFFLDCETIKKKYKTIEEMKEKLKGGLIKIKKDEEEVIEMDKKNVSGTLKGTWDQLMKLLDENEELKEDKIDKFIQNEEWKEILNNPK